MILWVLQDVDLNNVTGLLEQQSTLRTQMTQVEHFVIRLITLAQTVHGLNARVVTNLSVGKIDKNILGSLSITSFLPIASLCL